MLRAPEGLVFCPGADTNAHSPPSYDPDVGWPPEILLTQETVDGLRDASQAFDGRNPDMGVLKAIDTLYHEMTHGYLDMMHYVPEVRDLWVDGETYYSGAPMADGTNSLDSHRLFIEAAAGYVQNRVSALAYVLAQLEHIKAQVERRKMKIGQARNIFALLEKYYDERMAERVFGYEPRGETQLLTTKPISAELKEYLDTNILENMIPEAFSLSDQFRGKMAEIGAIAKRQK